MGHFASLHTEKKRKEKKMTTTPTIIVGRFHSEVQMSVSSNEIVAYIDHPEEASLHLGERELTVALIPAAQVLNRVTAKYGPSGAAELSGKLMHLSSDLLGESKSSFICIEPPTSNPDRRVCLIAFDSLMIMDRRALLPKCYQVQYKLAGGSDGPAPRLHYETASINWYPSLSLDIQRQLLTLSAVLVSTQESPLTANLNLVVTNSKSIGEDNYQLDYEPPTAFMTDTPCPPSSRRFNNFRDPLPSSLSSSSSSSSSLPENESNDYDSYSLPNFTLQGLTIHPLKVCCVDPIETHFLEIPNVFHIADWKGFVKQGYRFASPEKLPPSPLIIKDGVFHSKQSIPYRAKNQTIVIPAHRTTDIQYSGHVETLSQEREHRISISLSFKPALVARNIFILLKKEGSLFVDESSYTSNLPASNKLQILNQLVWEFELTAQRNAFQVVVKYNKNSY